MRQRGNWSDHSSYRSPNGLVDLVDLVDFIGLLGIIGLVDLVDMVGVLGWCLDFHFCRGV